MMPLQGGQGGKTPPPPKPARKKTRVAPAALSTLDIPATRF